MTKEEMDYKTALLKVVVEVRHDIASLEEDLERAKAVRQFCDAEILRLDNEEQSMGFDEWQESIIEGDLDKDAEIRKLREDVETYRKLANVEPTGAGKVMQEIDYRGEPKGPATTTFANPPGFQELLEARANCKQ